MSSVVYLLLAPGLQSVRPMRNPVHLDEPRRVCENHS